MAQNCQPESLSIEILGFREVLDDYAVSVMRSIEGMRVSPGNAIALALQPDTKAMLNPPNCLAGKPDERRGVTLATTDKRVKKCPLKSHSSRALKSLEGASATLRELVGRTLGKRQYTSSSLLLMSKSAKVVIRNKVATRSVASSRHR